MTSLAGTDIVTGSVHRSLASRIVARTGGLSDTIIDANDAALAAGVATGFQFTPVTAEALAATLSRALKCFRDAETWRGIQRHS